MSTTLRDANVTLIRAAGIIVFRVLMGPKVEYLLLQSSKKPHHWTSPKGHLEGEETEMEAAYRETREESGLLQEHLRLIKGSQIPLEYTVHGKPKRVTYWIAELIDPETPVIISREHQAFAWATLERAKELVGYDDAIKFMEKCHPIIMSDLNAEKPAE
ncbi:nudix (nucleoside diphosphate linked moiety X)-type motif 2 [Nesidiocoris tenuis]|uniref:Bis(5'-nucleosyl)-tetraphosphatase [asymmetrical] n=1 Tax=Nesidiocoris tenuis TaxID=355587 RepID=A0ABN7AC02_9HEMI|nr:nudix (nucleoside diphosphate linked moiety X)-type motif 2 [Nesidiocoris tenuis]